MISMPFVVLIAVAAFLLGALLGMAGLIAFAVFWTPAPMDKPANE